MRPYVSQRLVLERRPPVESVVVEEVFRVAGPHERGQVNLVEAVQLVSCVAVVEPPESSFRQDAPLLPACCM